MGIAAASAPSSFIAAVVFAGVALSAQQAPPATGRIAGQVVDAIDRRPVVGAHVSLSPKTGGSIGPIETDDSGHFRFSGLGPNAYSVIVAADGYAPSGEAQVGAVTSVWLDLAAAETRDNVMVSLVRSTLIVGTVGSGGRPAGGAVVFALRRPVRPDRGLESVAQAVSSPEGKFTFAGLLPGEYAFAVKPKITTEPVSVLHYFPSGSRAGQSMRVDLIAGAHIELPAWDIVPEPGYKVSGRALDDSGHGVAATVRLNHARADDSSDISVAELRTAPDGSFMFTGVPRGDYVVSFVNLPQTPPVRGQLVPSERRGFLSGKPLAPTPVGHTIWAESSFSVLDRDVAIAELRGVQGHSVIIHASFVGRRDPPSAAALSANCVYLRRLASSPLDVPGARFEADRVASSVPLPDGSYVLGLAAPFPGWTLASVRASGREILGRPFEVPSADLALTFTDEPARVSGTIRNKDGFPVAGALVYVVSTDRDDWASYGLGGGRLFSVTADRDGRFNVPAPAGSYALAAESPSPGFGNDLTPAVIERVASSGKRIVLSPREALSIDLTVVPRR